MMGYQEGDGIGKDKQGIRDPIQVEQRRRRLGLGFEASVTEDDEPIPDKLKWNIQEVKDYYSIYVCIVKFAPFFFFFALLERRNF